MSGVGGSPLQVWGHLQHTKVNQQRKHSGCHILLKLQYDDGVMLSDKRTVEPREFYEKRSLRMRHAIIWCWYLGVAFNINNERTTSLGLQGAKTNCYKSMFGVIVRRYLYLLADTYDTEPKIKWIVYENWWKVAQFFCLREVRAVQQPSKGWTTIFTVCIV